MGLHEGVSIVSRRRAFLAAIGAAPFLNEFALAQNSFIPGAAEGAVMINANEFPLGPCAEALAAVRETAANGGRYLFGEAFRLSEAAASSENVPASHCAAFAGSSDPLHRVVLAWCGKGLPLVTASPGYESPEGAAAFLNVPIYRVALRKDDYSHDIPAMLAAAAGKPALFYITTPNNPTGTLTPLAEIDRLVKEMAPGSCALIDEAYIHFSGAPAAISLIDGPKDVIVLRTFSKVYGMAGLRAGLAFARPEVLGRIRPYGVGFVPTTGMVGARVSLGVKGLVEQRREYVRKTRDSLCEWFREKGIGFIPSVSNKILFDAGRPGRELSAALARERVYVGRSWPSIPNHVRVTIGTPEEMAVFKTAMVKSYPLA
ncbi:MAG TPA: aminotransferase class I/II-fold pyridoxal phosphate-dependent enzyme [Bryobacteraceae bacterium]|nr:aminotransferase class I/II-fold pyridoxal phosphate-dependent enzyme [Bryobacteraceae bacterium]HPT25828.1 aminotransferase class I/II-fold pyridoxal phosphate-dependent enzyme [Bryobacteraceae bacterium]